MSAVELRGVAKSFGRVCVLEEVSLDIAAGELVALVGHSGCGKSTLLAMIAGLAQPSAGTIRVAGRTVSGPGPDRGVVFQSPCLLPWLTVLENVTLGLPRREHARAVHQLARVGLADAHGRRPAELSVGMQQRVGLARAFALEPAVLLLDEPFGMLDSVTRGELQSLLLAHESERRTTTVMVTHDVDEALLLSDRILVMTDGPAARIGAVIEVARELARPRERAVVEDSPAAASLRDEILGFLDVGAGRPPSASGAFAYG